MSWDISSDDNGMRGRMTHGLGAYIRRRRAELGLTQEQLEERSGLSQSTLSGLERGGGRTPRKETLEALAAALEVEVDDLKVALGWVVQVRKVVIAEDEVVLPVSGLLPADTLRFTSQEGVHVREVRVVREDLKNARNPKAYEITGDCMRAIGILAGDVVIIEPAEGRRPRHRQIVVVRIGDEYSLKRWVVSGDGVQLRDGDERIVERLNDQTEVELVGFYVTFKPLAPRD